MKTWLKTKGQVPLLALALLLSAFVAGCEGAAPQPGDPAAGEELYNTNLEEEPGRHACSECHTLETRESFGPTFLGIAERAGERVEGMTAEEYLRESIVDPKAYIAGDYLFPMPTVYGEILTDEQINDLIAFLLTL